MTSKLTKEQAKEVLVLLENLKGLTEVDKIVTTFIPAFCEKTIHEGLETYLHGSFRLGGTKSGRLSSAEPNLQQIPSTGTSYAKIIKQCFVGPEGWIFVGADYNALEARIGALVTRDPAKLAVYVDGYDSHSFNAFGYWPHKMPDIAAAIEGVSTEERVKIINSIATKYPTLRQASKTITFAAQYGGTYRTFMQSGGFSRQEAEEIEANYHKLYRKSLEWTEERMRKASKDGYVELAYGLRLRTPILKQVVYGSSSMPYEAHKEAKTASNALIQSYGLLNTQAANRFMKRVWASKWKHSIKPAAQIHDAIYLVIENKLGCLQWVNDNLIECMVDCNLPELEHPTVKLEAELEVYYPDWSKGHAIPNHLNLNELKDRLKHLGIAPSGC